MASSVADIMDLSAGKRIDILLRVGELSCSCMLSSDTWVLATIAAVKQGQVMVHISGGKARWVPLTAPELAAPGTRSGAPLVATSARNYVQNGSMDRSSTDEEMAIAVAAQGVEVGGKRKRPAV